GTAGRVSLSSLDPAVSGVIVTGAVRDEGTTRQYIPIEYPAVANRIVVAALADAATQSGACYLEGLAHCKDSFYGQIDPDGLPGGARLKARWQAWMAGNVLASEMETAALFVVSSIRGCRAGAIMSFREMDQTISIALAAIRQLIQADAER
ncbi:nucleoside phosphorylase, partial [Candidatus Saccharibacteria bacterium]|nr:nucleoside phosphorylase [Candidatus Saccharibacteria bacterium]